MNALHPLADHVIDRITACTAHPDHLDNRSGWLFFNDFKHLPRLLN